jgi:hypothetical protein
LLSHSVHAYEYVGTKTLREWSDYLALYRLKC